MGLILKVNFCFDVNGRFESTRMVTLYLNSEYIATPCALTNIAVLEIPLVALALPLICPPTEAAHTAVAARNLSKVARWQNFLGLRQGGGPGGAIQGKEGIKFCSVA